MSRLPSQEPSVASADERRKLVNTFVALDSRLKEATSRGSRAANDLEFETCIAEVRQLRAERAELHAQLTESYLRRY